MMDDLKEKIEELLKGLFSVKQQQDFFVPTLKQPSTAKPGPTPSGTQAPGAIKPLPGLKPPKAPSAKVAGGLPPPSKKDPAKVAAQMRSHPQKAPVEVLKVEDNGQWTLTKAGPGTESLTPKVTPQVAPPASPLLGTRSDRSPVATAAHQAANNTPVSSTEHGWGNIHSSEQNELIHGLVPHEAQPIGGPGVQGAKFAHSVSHPNIAVIKDSRQHTNRAERGHLKDNFNSARREVLFHNMAKNFFGLGKHVPTTAGFTKNGGDWSAQMKVDDASHPMFPKDEEDKEMKELGLINRNHEKVLNNLHNNGTLDKLAIMDHVMGHHDRHGRNMMIDDKGDNLHLIDNGTAFDYGIFDAHPIPKYRRLADDLGFRDDSDFHPEAKKWLASLNANDAKKMLMAHGHKNDSNAVKGFVSRLKDLQRRVANPPAFPNADAMLENSRALTKQKEFGHNG